MKFYKVAWNFPSIFILWFRGLSRKTAKLKCPEKCFLYPTAILKCSEILFLEFCCFYSILMWFEGFFAKRFFKILWCRKIKMTQILVYRMNREIKMPWNANMLEKYRKIKMLRKFDAAKISCNKVIDLTQLL